MDTRRRRYSSEGVDESESSSFGEFDAAARRSTLTLDVVNRLRISSLLVLAWACIQVAFLVAIGYGPGHHLGAWALCALGVAVGVALWLQKPWARYSALIFSAALLVFYGVVTYRYGLCPRHTLRCYARELTQPVLILGTVGLLILPTRWSKPFI